MSSRISLPGYWGKGFTLLELLVVMGIMVLALTLTPPLFSSALEGLQVKRAARELAAALRLARSSAVSSGREIVLALDVESRDFTLNHKTTRMDLPDNALLTLTTASRELISTVSGDIRFFPDGSSTGGRITLEHDARRYRIDVNWITGVVGISN